MAMKKIIIILMLGLLVSCGPSKEEIDVKIQEYSSQNNVTKLTPSELRDYVSYHYYGICNFTAREKDQIFAKISPLTQNSEDTLIIQLNYNKFSAIETNLPTGTIVATDYEGYVGGETMHRVNNNVSIKGSDGYTRIVKDIDVDLFNNLHKGDIIE